MKHRKLCWVSDRRGWLMSATRGGTTGLTWLTALERGGSACICAFDFLAKGTFLLITFSSTHIQAREVFVGSCCLVAQSLTLCDLMNCSTPGFPVLYYLPEFAQTHVHWVDDAIQPTHLLSPPSPPAVSLAQHQGLFQCSLLEGVLLQGADPHAVSMWAWLWRSAAAPGPDNRITLAEGHFIAN